MLYSPLPRTLDAALRDVANDKVTVRVSAIRDLVPHAEAARADVLRALERALEDGHAAVRAAAAEALGDVRGEEALPRLLVAIEDDDQLVRQQAIQALGLVGDPRAQRKLERSLADARPEVRFQAVIAYPRVTREKADAVARLAAATHDADEAVAHIAFRMAEELAAGEGEPVAAAILQRAAACVAKGPARVRVVAALIVISAPEASDAAVPGLGAARAEARRVAAAVAAGTLSGVEPEDVALAIELAGEQGLDEAMPALEKRAFGGFLGLNRDPYQWHARIALARRGNERAKRAILDELDARDVSRRTMAVAAAGKARLLEAKPLLLAMRGKPQRAEPTEVDAALALLAGEG